jgi:hypothetical protein
LALNGALGKFGGLMKFFTLFLLALSLSSFASEEYSNKIFMEIDNALVSQLLYVKEKKIYTPTNKFEPIVNFACGYSVSIYTFDEQLKSEYINGKVRVVSTFKSSGNIISYTPLRDLSGSSIRPALFKGHYFISK